MLVSERDTKTERKAHMEDKQKILDAFCKVLQMTRSCSDLVDIIYSISDESGLECAILAFKYGDRMVNITGDSGTAMLKDVLKAVD